MARVQEKNEFIFTLLGAAMGLGGVLRFPGLCYSFGGAFILAYALSLACVGFPLLYAELKLGKNSREPFPIAIKQVNRRAGALGWAACVNSALIAVYYSAVIARLACKTGTFYFEVNCDWSADMPWLTALFASLCWIFLAIMLPRKARRRARLARISVICQVALLSALAVRGLIFGNSAQALVKIFAVESGSLLNARMWSEALSQSLLSLSVAAGVMPAFSNAMPRGSSVSKCAVKVIAANFIGGVLSTVALLTTVYGCALTDKVGTNGFHNAFLLYPAALSHAFLNGVASGIFGTLFFASLTLTAFVSALSLLSALYVPLGKILNLPPRRTAVALCAVCALLSVAPVISFDYVGIADAITCGIIAPVIALAEIVIFLWRALLTMPRRSVKIFVWKTSKP